MVCYKQVTSIEYVGPHQIQTTSLPSKNFTAQIEPNSYVSGRDLESKKNDINTEVIGV